MWLIFMFQHQSASIRFVLIIYSPTNFGGIFSIMLDELLKVYPVLLQILLILEIPFKMRQFFKFCEIFFARNFFLFYKDIQKITLLIRIFQFFYKEMNKKIRRKLLLKSF